MGILNNIKDRFNNAEFTVAPCDYAAEYIGYKGSTKVGDAEKMFNDAFGVTVQIKDKAGKECVPNNITIGQAARGEY